MGEAEARPAGRVHAAVKSGAGLAQPEATASPTAQLLAAALQATLLASGSDATDKE